jgi:phosphate transport system permease protein
MLADRYVAAAVCISGRGSFHQWLSTIGVEWCDHFTGCERHFSKSSLPKVIVAGVFVYAIIVLPLKHFSAFAGGVALALIMVPIVARTTEVMIKLVPQSLREGALALGAPQWRVTVGIVIPAAASGIATGAMLAVARVSGETAPLLFTAFGSRFFNYHLDQPIASLTVQIYNYALSPYDDWHAQAWAATVVLMTLILLINVAVRFFTRKKF